ncbi:MAG: coenzyme F420-0:L-glutamate ligase [Lentisphaeria bacterium]|nr:coenzyme F420-0:L-glutamate ligase [Lentisphaeria bacterium]
MARATGTRVFGIRAPIVREGDDLAAVVLQALENACEQEHLALRERDVVGITESLVARAQGNYVTLDQIAAEVREKFPDGEIGVVFPILSRNRFAMILKAIARGARKVHVLLSYPADEVGNPLMDRERIDDAGVDPYRDVLTEADYRRLFGEDVPHPFTGIDYVRMYREVAENGRISVYLANDPRAILPYCSHVLAADIHSRRRTKRVLRKAGAAAVYGLDDLCTVSRNGSGFNPQYGLLGSNKATEERIKLFPRDGQALVDRIQAEVKQRTGKTIEVMIYGDGAFKDPVAEIWELADPVVAPAYTAGLAGTPNEIKIKYFADNKLSALSGSALTDAMKQEIQAKGADLLGRMETQGTTPRRFADLLGSLCDLTSGSGDKGTPIVLIQGYFDNYASE